MTVVPTTVVPTIVVTTIIVYTIKVDIFHCFHLTNFQNY